MKAFQIGVPSILFSALAFAQCELPELNACRLEINLNSPINTASARIDDKFTAQVLRPGALAGSQVLGRVVSISPPGVKSGAVLEIEILELRARGNSYFLRASFERSGLPDNVDGLDEQGRFVGKGSGGKIAGATAIGAGAGAALGAIFGGRKTTNDRGQQRANRGRDAAIGAGIGAAGGAVLASTTMRPGDILLDTGTVLTIQASTLNRSNRE